MKRIILDGKTPAPLITEKEAAEFLAISQSTIKRIRYAKEIESYRIGGKVFYSYEQIKSFLEKCFIGGERCE